MSNFFSLKKSFEKYKLLQFSLFSSFPLQEVATIGNKRKLVAVSSETQDHPRNSQTQKTSVSGNTDEYITQVSEKIEGRVTKKLIQEFGRTKSRFLRDL